MHVQLNMMTVQFYTFLVLPLNSASLRHFFIGGFQQTPPMPTHRPRRPLLRTAVIITPVLAVLQRPLMTSAVCVTALPVSHRTLRRPTSLRFDSRLYGFNAMFSVGNAHYCRYFFSLLIITAPILQDFLSAYNGDVFIIFRLLLPLHQKRVFNMKDRQLVKAFSDIFRTRSTNDRWHAGFVLNSSIGCNLHQAFIAYLLCFSTVLIRSSASRT